MGTKKKLVCKNFYNQNFGDTYCWNREFREKYTRWVWFPIACFYSCPSSKPERLYHVMQLFSVPERVTATAGVMEERGNT
jgi:hypothetical protein